MLKLNLTQRLIAFVAGILLLLFAISATGSYDDTNKWLPTAQFVLAVISFIVAASSKAPDRTAQSATDDR